MIRSQLHLIGQPVRSLQTMLRTISFAYPFLPRLTPDGIFGERTLEAVMLFQREFFPPVTGQVNQATWDAIVSLYHQVVSRLTPLPTRSFPSPEFSVAPGEASVHLNLVQSMFCGLSRVLNGVETCDVSGVNNAATEHNIKWIQHLITVRKPGRWIRRAGIPSAASILCLSPAPSRPGLRGLSFLCPDAAYMCKVGALSIAGHPPCLQFQLQVTVPDWELHRCGPPAHC